MPTTNFLTQATTAQSAPDVNATSTPVKNVKERLTTEKPDITDLFSHFTASIIQQDVLFTR